MNSNIDVHRVSDWPDELEVLEATAVEVTGCPCGGCIVTFEAADGCVFAVGHLDREATMELAASLNGAGQRKPS